MDRRSLLKQLVGFGLLLGLYSRFRPAVGAVDFVLAPGPLKTQLTALADPRFSLYARGKTLTGLISSLVDKGAIALDEGVKHDIIAALAQQEPQLLYQGFFYTETELDLYALAFMASQSFTPSLS